MFLGAVSPHACLEAWCSAARLSRLRCLVDGVSYLGRALPSTCAFSLRKGLFAVARRWFSSEAGVPGASSSPSPLLNVAILEMSCTVRPRNRFGISKARLVAVVESVVESKPWRLRDIWCCQRWWFPSALCLLWGVTKRGSVWFIFWSNCLCSS